MRKLIVLLIAAALGVLAWLRLRRTEESEPQVAEAPSPLGELGGEVDPELLAILACPLDKQSVTRQGNYLVCSECGRMYPIRDGIPVMLVEEAILPERPPEKAESPETSAVVSQPAPVSEAGAEGTASTTQPTTGAERLAGEA